MHQHMITLAVAALVLPPALAMIRSHRRSRATKNRNVSKKSAEASPEIDFTMQHGPAPSAAETLRALADSCDELGIDYPDMYGATRPGGKPWLSEFENKVVQYFGKPAAVFVPSGTMAQQIVLCCAQKIKLGGDRIPALPVVRKPFFCHPTSHLLLWEQEAHSRLLNIPALPCGTRDQPMSASDLEAQVDSAMDPNHPPCAVFLEVPHREIGGEVTPWADIQALRSLCDAHNLHFHCDGARLWEALPHYEKSNNLSASELCAAFDSVYVSFYKGLNGMTGAMLIGETAFIQDARIWLRRFGGNLFTALPYAASGLAQFNQCHDSFGQRLNAAQKAVEAVKRAAQATGMSHRLVLTPDPPQCPMVHVHIEGAQEDVERAATAASAASGFRVLSRIRGQSWKCGMGWIYFEWTFGSVNSEIAVEDIELGWSAFLKALKEV